MKNRVAIGYAVVVVLSLIPNTFVWYVDAVLLDARQYPFAVFAIAAAAILVVLRPVYLVVTMHPEPTRQLLRDCRNYAPWLVTTALMIFAVSFTLKGYLGMRAIIPYVNPFWADPILIQIDRVLFLGRDAWQFTHAFSPPIVTRAIDYVYWFWQVAQVAFCAGVCLLMNDRMRLQLILSLQLTWIFLGGISATLFASVGPVFVEEFLGRTDFAPLMQLLREQNAYIALFSMNYLLEVQGTDAIANGITAMPSMHVAIGVLIALGIRERFPRFQAAGWIFLALTYFGSIHLGWHYATDGVLSAIVVLIIWKLVRMFLSVLLGDNSLTADQYEESNGKRPAR